MRPIAVCCFASRDKRTRMKRAAPRAGLLWHTVLSQPVCLSTSKMAVVLADKSSQMPAQYERRPQRQRSTAGTRNPTHPIFPDFVGGQLSMSFDRVLSIGRNPEHEANESPCCEIRFAKFDLRVPLGHGNFRILREYLIHFTSDAGISNAQSERDFVDSLQGEWNGN